METKVTKIQINCSNRNPKEILIWERFHELPKGFQKQLFMKMVEFCELDLSSPERFLKDTVDMIASPFGRSQENIRAVR